MEWLWRKAVIRTGERPETKRQTLATPMPLVFRNSAEFGGR
jgi:hypothetical protein